MKIVRIAFVTLLICPLSRTQVVQEIGNIAQMGVLYASASERQTLLYEKLQGAVAACGARSDQECEEARQKLREIEASRKQEAEFFRAMGFPPSVKDWDGFKTWFHQQTAAYDQSTLDGGKYAFDFARNEINTYCYVVHQSMYSTERNRVVYQQCLQDYNPELTAQIHRVAWATCFSQYDWTGQYPKGTRAAYDECMRQKDIYSSFCNQKKTVVDAFYAREHPNVRSTPSPPCGGPMPTGREIQVLRMLANNMQITPATMMTPVADGSASNAGGQPREVIVPVGVMMSIRSIDRIDVAGVRSTNRFRARLEGDSVKSNGREVIPVGTELFLKATVKANGWVSLSVDYAMVNGMRLPLVTNEVMRAVPGIQKEAKEGSISRLPPQFPRAPMPSRGYQTVDDSAVVLKAGTPLMFRIVGNR